MNIVLRLHIDQFLLVIIFIDAVLDIILILLKPFLFLALFLFLLFFLNPLLLLLLLLLTVSASVLRGVWCLSMLLLLLLMNSLPVFYAESWLNDLGEVSAATFFIFFLLIGLFLKLFLLLMRRMLLLLVGLPLIDRSILGCCVSVTHTVVIDPVELS